jgi:hypothetical protein
VIDETGVIDGVDVGKGISVLVEANVRVGEIVGDGKLAGCICVKSRGEAHPAIVIKVIKINHFIVIIKAPEIPRTETSIPT